LKILRKDATLVSDLGLRLTTAEAVRMMFRVYRIRLAFAYFQLRFAPVTCLVALTDENGENIVGTRRER
jgi:hypothetical protein